MVWSRSSPLRWALLGALLGAAPRLAPRADGPPAFLLDAQRSGSGVALDGGTFDNRWFVFGSDFPSADHLRQRGLRRLAVACRGGRVAPDLRDALHRHRDLELVVLEPGTGATTAFPGPASGVLRRLATLGRFLRRNADGSFGRPISHG